MTDLLKDDWIPVRPKNGGQPCQISLRTLLCDANTAWQPHLPRDDMELALVQLLCALVQVCWMPKDKSAWLQRVQQVLSEADYQAGIAPYAAWFQLEHAEYPFMQVRKVSAKEPTDMDKLLLGLDSGTDSCFVNQPNLAAGLCGGCVAIALFNQSTQAPGFGGGFKQGLKGVGVSTLLRVNDLRMTVCLNVLSNESLDKQGLQTWREFADQKPTWVEPIVADSVVPAAAIGLLRGLFWQPLHLRLSEPEGAGLCSCCGQHVQRRYTRFDKARFSFTVEGKWPHPYAPRTVIKKKGENEERFVSFTTEAPSWTQLDSYVDSLENEKETYRPAPVIRQARDYLPRALQQLVLLVGGYRNNQAAIVERRLTPFSMAQGWLQHTPVIRDVVSRGLEYKSALREALSLTSKGIDKVRGEQQKKIKSGKKFKGIGFELQKRAESDFFRRSTPIIDQLLASIDFDNPMLTYHVLHGTLAKLCRELFEEVTAPYRHDLEVQETIALTRRILNKHLGELAPQNVPPIGASL